MLLLLLDRSVARKVQHELGIQARAWVVTCSGYSDLTCRPSQDFNRKTLMDLMYTGMEF